jgi:hypothetical protein
MPVLPLRGNTAAVKAALQQLPPRHLNRRRGVAGLGLSKGKCLNDAQISDSVSHRAALLTLARALPR